MKQINFTLRFAFGINLVFGMAHVFGIGLVVSAPVSAATSAATTATTNTTIVAERNGKLVRPLKLERLTYGPDDSYQVSPGEDGEIYFSLKTHMSPGLSILDLTSLKSRPLHESLRDADQPALSPDARKLAYRSLARSPEGEICLYSFSSKSSDCPNLQAGEKSSPVWIDSNSFAYLRKDNITGDSRLESFNIFNQTITELNRGRIYHPSYSSGRGLLVWVERESRQTLRQNILIAKVMNGKLDRICPVNITWPGLSAFPKINSDGTRLVFSHYLTDSNHDGRIDADDSSMIASVALPAETSSGECVNAPLTPEPLTSIADNCSQPALVASAIYMSCAVEGSLDLYRIPAGGVIPTNWDAPTLLEAHAAARSPEERLLYLLSLGGRFPGRYPGLEAGIFTQHLLLDDEAGARNHLPAENLALWELAIRAGEIRKSEPSGEISLSLRQRFADLRNSLSKSPNSFLRSVVQARIERLAGGNENFSFAQNLREAVKRQPASPLEFLLFSLEWELQPSASRDETLYIIALKKTRFETPESPLIYWAKALERLEDSNPLVAGKIPAKRREAVIRWQKSASEDAKLLLQLEMLALDVSEVSDVTDDQKHAYLKFDKLFSDTRGRGDILRLSAYRAIRMWTRSDRLKEVEFVASNLLKFIPAPSLEWTYARDYFIATSFDRAYEQVRKNLPAVALGHFYGAATLTDDLEAHWGYINTMVAAGRANQLGRQIDELKKRAFIDKSEPFIRDLVVLGEAKSGLPPDVEGWLAKAKSHLQNEDPLGNFILGSVRLQWLINNSGLKADQKNIELEKARLELIYALDGARENERLRLSVLTQLGLLSSWSKEWGAAQRYWQQRMRAAFDTPEDAAVAAYLRAQALFGIQDFQSANELLNKTKFADKGPLAEPVWHLRLQVASFAEKHDEVLQLMPKGEIPVSNRTEARRALLFARSLLKTSKPQPACQLLSRLGGYLERQTSSPRPDSPRGDHPERLRILALGYESQCAAGTPNEMAVLGRYKSALALKDDQQKALGFSLLNFLELRMKNQIRLWMAGATMESSGVRAYLADLEAHRTEAGAFVQLGQFEAMQALGGLILLKKAALPADETSALTERMGSFLESAKRATTSSDLVKSQEIRLRSLRDRLDPRAGSRVGGVTVVNQEILSELTRLKEKNPFLGVAAENYVSWVKTL